MTATPWSDLDLIRRGWHWGLPRPQTWAPAAPGVPDRASNLGWARAEPVRSLRFLIQRGLLLPFTRLVADPKVEGSEWVKDLERPVILASNHVSHADTHLLLYALSQRTRERTVVAAAADYWYQRPWLGRALSLGLNTFPFSRTGGPAAVLHSSSELLKSGWNLLVFPEGTRSQDGRLQPFKPGVGHLATETKAPVIPVYVSGSHRIMPKGQRIPLPAPATIKIGRPLLAGRAEGSRAFTSRIEAAVRALSGAVRTDASSGTWIDRWQAAAPKARPLR
ncbi:MAG TPA: lysophospholipid acyltransferase family protein [Candidatus Acidoferrales bacterium]|nr:lysophospholipid acyltransferase family protein [Candidatus Acidoferrales bacterium]